MLSDRVLRFKNKLAKSKLAKSKLARGIVGSFGLRLAYTALTFVTSILLARVLGTVGFGLYSYAVVWAYLLSVPATLGFDTLLVREVAILQKGASWPLLRGLLRWADRSVLMMSVAIALIAMATAWLLDAGNNSPTFVGLCAAIALMPALSLRNIRRGAMRGLHKITQGLLPELLIDPLLLIMFTSVGYLLLPQRLSALWVIAFYGMSTVITLLISQQFLTQALPLPVKSVEPLFKRKAWLSGALPFILIESISLLNSRADVLMLGALRGAEAVGLYVPVNRGAQLINFILMAVGSTLAPTIASAYAENRLVDLQRTVTKSVRLVTGVAFLFAIALIILSNYYLALFGPEFLQGRRALYILCIGIFISTAAGLFSIILNMTGHERFTALLGWSTTGLNIGLNAVFIPRWGIEGAAAATAISLVLRAMVGLIAVRKKLGIDATLMGLPARLS